jgi:hypothetical protein
LDERIDQRLERIFLLIALIYSPRDIYSVYYNCRLKPALRPSAAVEFLDNLLDPPLKQTIVPLLEAAFEPEKVRGMQQSLQFISHAAALATVRSGQDPWLDVIAKELVKRMGNKSNEAEIVELSPIDKVLCLQSVDGVQARNHRDARTSGSIAHEVNVEKVTSSF